jgi:hypothetical protein
MDRLARALGYTRRRRIHHEVQRRANDGLVLKIVFSGVAGRSKANERQESRQLQERTPVHVRITTKRDRLAHEMLTLDTRTCGRASGQAVRFPDGTEVFGASSSSPRHRASKSVARRNHPRSRGATVRCHNGLRSRGNQAGPAPRPVRAGARVRKGTLCLHDHAAQVSVGRGGRRCRRVPDE